MARDLGNKYVCFKCGTKFYDLRKPIPTCPKCGTDARRETDTLDTFMDSAWYAFRFIDSHNADAIFDSTLVNKWMPINFYVGALEHAAQHMIYFRFLAQFFHEIGLTRRNNPPRVDEPQRHQQRAAQPVAN